MIFPVFVSMYVCLCHVPEDIVSLSWTFPVSWIIKDNRNLKLKHEEQLDSSSQTQTLQPLNAVSSVESWQPPLTGSRFFSGVIIKTTSGTAKFLWMLSKPTKDTLQDAMSSVDKTTAAIAVTQPGRWRPTADEAQRS